MRRCTHIMRMMHWIGTEVTNPPFFEGISKLNIFLREHEEKALDYQRLLVLDVALHAT